MIAAAQPRKFEIVSVQLLSLVAAASVFLIPMKALSINIGGNSLYFPYFAALIFLALSAKPLLDCMWQEFRTPALIVIGLSIFHFAFTGFHWTVFVFPAKILLTLLVAALYVILLRTDEEAQIRLVFWGALLSIAYMVYQAISTLAFGGHLPLTTIPSLEIGRGISSRFGFPRMTGFTEEPSYIAVVLLGILFILISYARRTGLSQRKRIQWIAFGLLLCTSNSLFATLPLVLIFALFAFFRVPFLFFVAFYLANFLVMPYLINWDESFFARLQSYRQFLGLDPFHMLFGIGFNQYASAVEAPQFISPEGIPLLTVSSIASLWGGVLFEGGLVFATLFCGYVTDLYQRAKDGFGFAFIVVLIMLANYYSPWWPIVSFALAYVVISREPVQNQKEVAA